MLDHDTPSCFVTSDLTGGAPALTLLCPFCPFKAFSSLQGLSQVHPPQEGRGRFCDLGPGEGKKATMSQQRFAIPPFPPPLGPAHLQLLELLRHLPLQPEESTFLIFPKPTHPPGPRSSPVSPRGALHAPATLTSSWSLSCVSSLSPPASDPSPLLCAGKMTPWNRFSLALGWV